MEIRRVAPPALLLALAAVAHAAEALTDEELVKLCIAETLARDGEDASGGSPKIVGSAVTRAAEQQVVNVQLTLAEGRSLSGRCIVRNGKVFDFKS